MPLYPLKFVPLYKTKVWGGRLLGSALNRGLPPGEPIGESWELADRDDNNSIIRNGTWAGMSMRELLQKERRQIMGDRLALRYPAEFPLLIKFIDASDDLSIQVHPDDDMASQLAHDSGKTEFWYIIRTEPETIINYGIQPGIDRDMVESSIRSGRIRHILQFYPVEAGDSLFIPAGCVHAIMKGTLLAEIQQNSDVTYRLYDWDRPGLDGRPRPLHLDQGMAALKLFPNLKIRSARHPSSRLADCPYFRIDRISLQPGQSIPILIDHPVILMIIRGKGSIGSESFDLGETILLPAGLKITELKNRPETDALILKISVK